MGHDIILSRLKLEVNKIKIEKIHHVRIIVHDIEEARKRWGALFELEFTPPRDAPQVDIAGASSPIGVDFASPLSPDGPVARGLEKRGEGLGLLSLQVSNLDEAVKEMEAKGVRCVTNTPGRSAIFHPKDLNGVMVELIKG